MLLIKGTHIIIRDIMVADFDSLSHWLHPSHDWHTLNGPYYPPEPEEKIPDIIGSWGKHIATGDFPTPRRRLIIADYVNQEVLGMVTRYWISQETNWTAIGIVIYDPNNWGKGYGYEALGLWCEYLFAHEPRFVRLDCRTWSGNDGMMNLATKLGFKQEAVFRKARIVDDEYYDGMGYGILREEWEAKYPQGFADSLRS